MRTRLAVVMLCAGVLLSPGVAAKERQARPDFSGTWIWIADKDSSPDALPFGERFTASQYSTALVLDWQVQGRQGRGGAGRTADRLAHSAFLFDGTDCNVTEVYVTGSRVVIADTVSWDAARLVVHSHRRTSTPPKTTRKRVLWLDAEGTLRVETSLPTDTGDWTTVLHRYRRNRISEPRLHEASVLGFPQG